MITHLQPWDHERPMAPGSTYCRRADAGDLVVEALDFERCDCVACLKAALLVDEDELSEAWQELERRLETLGFTITDEQHGEWSMVKTGAERVFNAAARVVDIARMVRGAAAVDAAVAAVLEAGGAR